jgi:hypothetical protein
VIDRAVLDRLATVAMALCVIAAAAPAVAFDYQRFEALRNAPSLAAAQAADRVGLRALQAFDGPDLAGGDGPMARGGLDLALLYAEFTDYVANGRPGRFATSLVGVRVDGDRVLVDAIADDDAQTVVLPQLQALGLVGNGARGRVASGWLPMNALDAASRVPGLRLLRPVYAVTHAGVVTSQGDVALRAAAARATYGLDGTGVTVGALSDSFNCKGGYASDVGTGDLPANVNVLQEVSSCSGSNDEGRAMLQIVHDLAPGAQLAFHSAFNGTASFAQGILDLAGTAGARVIVDDVGILTEPVFQDGPIAQAVDTVVAGGAAYFSAAGNEARNSYESAFRPVMANGKTRHDFDPGTGVDTLQKLRVPAGAVVEIMLQWNQPFYSVSGPPGATGDLDLVLYGYPVATELLRSGQANVGGDAVDILAFQNTGSSTLTAQLAIELRNNTTAPTQIKYIYFGSVAFDEWTTQSSTVFGHPNAAGARAVGAADYRLTPCSSPTPLAAARRSCSTRRAHRSSSRATSPSSSRPTASTRRSSIPAPATRTARAIRTSTARRPPHRMRPQLRHSFVVSSRTRRRATSTRRCSRARSTWGRPASTPIAARASCKRIARSHTRARTPPGAR